MVLNWKRILILFFLIGYFVHVIVNLVAHGYNDIESKSSMKIGFNHEKRVSLRRTETALYRASHVSSIKEINIIQAYIGFISGTVPI